MKYNTRSHCLSSEHAKGPAGWVKAALRADSDIYCRSMKEWGCQLRPPTPMTLYLPAVNANKACVSK